MLALAGAARADDGPDSAATQARLDAANATVEAGQAELERLATETDKLSAELARLRRELVRRAASLRDQEDAIELATVQLAGLRAEAANRRTRLDARRGEVAVVLARLTRMSRRPPAAALAAPGSPIDALRGAGAMRAMIGPLKSEADTLAGELAELAALTEVIDGRRERLEIQRNEALLARRGMRDLVETRKRAHRDLTRHRSEADQQVQQALEQSRSLQALLKQLLVEEARRLEQARLAAAEAEARAEAARRAEAAARQAAAVTAALRKAEAARQAAEEAQRKAAKAAGRTAPAQQLAALPGGGPALFSTRRGHLPMPVAGPVIGRFGAADRVGQRTKGIKVRARAGATVVAPHDAEVAFAGQFRGYGLLLILSQGEGYHILLAGMSRLYAVTGQPVLAGEPVGEMGPDGSDTTLYVELRREGEPINPLSWITAGKGKVSG
ncbi:MAG: peptidoglycan DD-metalloendopeptidase family protein [Alphaproteobacteria bacterium]